MNQSIAGNGSYRCVDCPALIDRRWELCEACRKRGRNLAAHFAHKLRKRVKEHSIPLAPDIGPLDDGWVRKLLAVWNGPVSAVSGTPPKGSSLTVVRYWNDRPLSLRNAILVTSAEASRLTRAPDPQALLPLRVNKRFAEQDEKGLLVHSAEREEEDGDEWIFQSSTHLEEDESMHGNDSPMIPGEASSQPQHSRPPSQGDEVPPPPPPPRDEEEERRRPAKKRRVARMNELARRRTPGGLVARRRVGEEPQEETDRFQRPSPRVRMDEEPHDETDRFQHGVISRDEDRLDEERREDRREEERRVVRRDEERSADRREEERNVNGPFEVLGPGKSPPRQEPRGQDGVVLYVDRREHPAGYRVSVDAGQCPVQVVMRAPPRGTVPGLSFTVGPDFAFEFGGGRRH